MKSILVLFGLSIIIISCNKHVEKSEFDNMSRINLNDSKNIGKISEILKTDPRISKYFKYSDDLMEQLKINRKSSNYESCINTITFEKDNKVMAAFFQKTENANFKDFYDILVSTVDLKNDIQKDYPFIKNISLKNIDVLAEELLKEHLIMQNKRPINKAVMSSGDKCSDAYHRANSRCERNGDIGMFVCLFTLPSGMGYLACTAAVVIGTVNCFNDAEEDFRFCAKK